MAGVDIRLEPHAYRELHWHSRLPGRQRLVRVPFESGGGAVGDRWQSQDHRPSDVSCCEHVPCCAGDNQARGDARDPLAPDKRRVEHLPAGLRTRLCLPKSSRTFDFATGDVVYVPVAQSHYFENTGDEDIIVLEVLQAPHFSDVSVA